MQQTIAPPAMRPASYGVSWETGDDANGDIEMHLGRLLSTKEFDHEQQLRNQETALRNAYFNLTPNPDPARYIAALRTAHDSITHIQT